MKLIGSKDVFAYQWELIDYGNTFYWGNFCFWISGIEVGLYYENTTLSITLSRLKDFLKEEEKRVYFRSERVSKDKLFYEIYDKFVDEDYKGDQAESFGYFRDTFWLDEVGEDSIRDKIGIILINEPYANRQRLIWKYFKSNNIEEAFIPYNYFEGVSQQFVEILSAEINSLK